MKVVGINDVEKIEMDMEGASAVLKQVPVSKNDGSPSFSVRVMNVGVGGHSPYHNHPFEHLNYVISGRGVMVKESGEELEINAGDFALVLPDETHQYKTTSSTEPLVFICAVPKEYE